MTNWVINSINEYSNDSHLYTYTNSYRKKIYIYIIRFLTLESNDLSNWFLILKFSTRIFEELTNLDAHAHLLCTILTRIFEELSLIYTHTTHTHLICIILTRIFEELFTHTYTHAHFIFLLIRIKTYFDENATKILDRHRRLRRKSS